MVCENAELCMRAPFLSGVRWERTCGAFAGQEVSEETRIRGNKGALQGYVVHNGVLGTSLGPQIETLLSLLFVGCMVNAFCAPNVRRIKLTRQAGFRRYLRACMRALDKILGGWAQGGRCRMLFVRQVRWLGQLRLRRLAVHLLRGAGWGSALYYIVDMAGGMDEDGWECDSTRRNSPS